MTHCDKILARLRRGPATANELYALGTVAHSRVSDLRKRGHVIEHTVDRGVHIYTLLSERDGVCLPPASGVSSPGHVRASRSESSASLERGEPKADNDEVAAPNAAVFPAVPCEPGSPLSSDAAHQADTGESMVARSWKSGQPFRGAPVSAPAPSAPVDDVPLVVPGQTSLFELVA